MNVDDTTVDPSGSSPDGSSGFVVGFPTRAVIANESGVVLKASILGFGGWQFAGGERLGKAGLNPDVNLAVICPNKVFVDNVRLHERQFKGLSGGAVWRTDPTGEKLVGIFTGYLKSKSLLFGTRLSSLVSMLSQ